MHRKLLCALMVLAALPAHAEVPVKTTGIGHGVEVWYSPNDTVPVIDVQIVFEGAGNVSDPEGKGGRAAFAAGLLTEGAGVLDSPAFQRALEEKAITLDASTSDDRLTIHVHCLRDDAARAGELLALALSKPQLADGDVARIKAQMGSLLTRLEESPNYQATRLLESRAFAGHPYANAPYGTQASVATLNAQDVRDYLKTYVTRGNVLITAAGDVDSSTIDTMLEPLADALVPNDAGPVPVTPAPMQGGGESLRQTMGVPQSVVQFRGPSVARDDPQFYAVYLMNHILGGNTLISRLGDQVRKQKGLVYGVNSYLDIRRGTTLIAGNLATRNSTADAATAEVKAVMQTLHDKGVTTEECADAKSDVLGSYPLELDSSTSVAERLMMMRVNRLGQDYLSKRQDYFTRVTCADINAAAAQYLDPAKFLFATVGGTVDAPGPAPVAAPAGDAR